MALQVDISVVPELGLEFGGPGVFHDPKEGLREVGPFDLRFGAAHLSQVKVGFVGPADVIDRAKAWFERCKTHISVDDTDKAMYPDYPGFNATFSSDLQMDDRWTAELASSQEVERVLAADNPYRFNRMLDLYANAIWKLANLEVSKPDVVICCLSKEIRDKCWSREKPLSPFERQAAKKLSEHRSAVQPGLFDDNLVEEDESDLLFRDFRRALKAKAMGHRMPIQLATDGLFLDSARNQDAATRAWNSNVALYYKAGGIPWRLKIDGPETCFVGVSFHHLKTVRQHLVHSSIAQAFSTQGEGFALRGETVPWGDKFDRTPHLSDEQAFRLGTNITQEYESRTGNSPLRVVLHKTTEFDEAERHGFRQAFKDVPVVELINIMPTQFRLVRFGTYPPNRGTLCTVNGANTYLFTSGYMPQLQTYPGPHIPSPMRLKSDQPVDLERAATEILGLTRMNWNTADIKTNHPVTLFFARRIGGIMAEYGDGDGLLPSFRYYI